MTYYFIKEGKNEEGPFTLEQLKHKSVEKKTKVWFAGLKEWTSVENVYELNELFDSSRSEHRHHSGFLSFFRKLFSKKDARPAFQVVNTDKQGLN